MYSSICSKHFFDFILIYGGIKNILSPRFALRKRIEQYCDYIDDGKFTEATGHDFPTLLFICPGYASLIYLKKHIARIYEETSLDQIEIYIATKEQAFAGSWEKIEAEQD